jgi:hypothetical protein
MGEDWHKIQDERTGNKRIAEDADWVREEIRTAIERNIRIFILRLEAAELPEEGWIPEDIRPFLASQATQIRQANVDADLEPVLEELTRVTGIPRSRADSPGRSAGLRPSVQMEKPGALLEGVSAQKTSLVCSRAPIVIVIEEGRALLKSEGGIVDGQVNPLPVMRPRALRASWAVRWTSNDRSGSRRCSDITSCSPSSRRLPSR